MDPNKPQQPGNPAATAGIPQNTELSQAQQAQVPPTQATPATTPPPTLDPAPTVPPEHQAGSSHKIILVVVVVALLIVIGGAAYLFFMQPQAAPEPEPITVQEPTPTIILTPTEAPIEGTVEEVEKIDVGDPANDTTDLQTDLKEL